MANNIKTVQIPEDTWLKLREVARSNGHNISSFLRVHIAKIHADLIKKQSNQ